MTQSRKAKLEYSKEYYKKNKKKVLARHKEYVKNNKEKVNKVLNNWRSRNPERLILSHAKQRAKNKDMEFDLDIDDIKIPKKCPVLGLTIENNFGMKRGAQPNSPSLDRIDNSKGYTKKNVRIISHRANSHKGDMSKKDIKNLYLYSIGER